MKEEIIKLIQAALDGDLSAEEFESALAELAGSECEQLDDLVGTHDIYPYRDLIVTKQTVSKQIGRLLNDEINLERLRQDWTDLITLLDPGFEDNYEEILLEAIYTIDNYEDLKDGRDELLSILEEIEVEV